MTQRTLEDLRADCEESGAAFDRAVEAHAKTRGDVEAHAKTKVVCHETNIVYCKARRAYQRAAAAKGHNELRALLFGTAQLP